jgi:hypothetical protein
VNDKRNDPRTLNLLVQCMKSIAAVKHQYKNYEEEVLAAACEPKLVSLVFRQSRDLLQMRIDLERWIDQYRGDLPF